MTNLNPEFKWQWAAFSELGARDIYTMLAARSEVFVIEQQCLYADMDGQDPDAWHLLVHSQKANPELAGYLRVLPPDEPGVAANADVRIGRVLTRAPFRGYRTRSGDARTHAYAYRSAMARARNPSARASSSAALLRKLRLRAHLGYPSRRRHPAYLDASCNAKTLGRRIDHAAYIGRDVFDGSVSVASKRAWPWVSKI